MRIMILITCVLLSTGSSKGEPLKNDLVSQIKINKKVQLEVNVKQFGAKGDGVNDDTKAIQDAINYTFSKKLSTVIFPTGRYRLGKGSITVKQGVMLKGIDKIPAKSGFGSDLCQFEIVPAPENRNKPAFVVESFSGIVGFSFFYPNQPKSSSTPIIYGWTITTNGSTSQDGITLRNLMLTNSYQAIKLDNGGQHSLDNIYGQPIKYGIYIDRQYDVLRVNNIHFWPFYSQPGQALYKWIETNGEAIVLNRTDGLQGNNWFAYGYKSGLHLDNIGNGSPWLTASNLLFDVCRQPIVVDAVAYLTLNSVTLTGVDVSLSETGILISSNVKDINSIIQINGLTTINFVNSLVNKGLSTMAVSMKSKIYDGKNNGVRWFDIINENDNAVMSITIPLRPGDDYRRVAGKMQINGQYSYQSLTDITPQNFSDVSNWAGSKDHVIPISKGARFNLVNALSTSSYLLPKSVREVPGIYVLEMTLKSYSSSIALGTATFYLRLRDYVNGIDYSLTPSISDPYFYSEVTLKVPFLVNNSDVYLDFVFGNATNTSKAYVEVTNLKLHKANGTQVGYKELMPKPQKFNN